MKQKVSDLTYLGTEIIKNGESSLDEILKENYPVFFCDDNDNSIEISDLELLYTPVQKKIKEDRFHPCLRNFRNSIFNGTGQNFWRANKDQYKELFDIYCKLSSIQATSASIERLFSLANLIFNDLSASMDTETIFYRLVNRLNN